MNSRWLLLTLLLAVSANARALTPDPSGWQGWLVSFATGQAF